MQKLIEQAHPNYVFHLIGRLGGAQMKLSDLKTDLASHGIKGAAAHSLLWRMRENKIIEVTGKLGEEKVGLSSEYLAIYYSKRK